MRARRSAYERAGDGFVLRPPVQARERLSDTDGRRLLALGVSLGVHVMVVAVLLLWRHGPPRGEEESAPAFAIQFDSGTPQPSPPAPASEPRVSLGGSEYPPPPTEEDAEPLPVPIRRPHYGSALRPREPANPFAHVTPFDLSPTQPRSLSAGLPGSHALDLSAGPVVRNGRLLDSVSHTRGRHGTEDYLEELRAFVEEHKYYPPEAAERGEEGAATLEITVARDGHVKRLRWLQHSGSQLLDEAWYAVFNDNTLPPLSDDVPGNELTLPVELDYHLLYGNRSR